MKELNNRTMEFSSKRDRKRKRDLHRSKPRAINFEAYASEGNRFIWEVAEELDTDRDTAARITRSVLQAVRDRLPPIDAVQFGQGLPMALKAVYFDRYQISKTPVRIRTGEKFIDYIINKDGQASDIDFPDDESVVKALQGVFRVLERNMDFGQVHQIKYMMSSEIVSLIDPEFEREEAY